MDPLSSLPPRQRTSCSIEARTLSELPSTYFRRFSGKRKVTLPSGETTLLSIHRFLYTVLTKLKRRCIILETGSGATKAISPQWPAQDIDLALFPIVETKEAWEKSLRQLAAIYAETFTHHLIANKQSHLLQKNQLCFSFSRIEDPKKGLLFAIAEIGDLQLIHPWNLVRHTTFTVNSAAINLTDYFYHSQAKPIAPSLYLYGVSWEQFQQDVEERKLRLPQKSGSSGAWKALSNYIIHKGCHPDTRAEERLLKQALHEEKLFKHWLFGGKWKGSGVARFWQRYYWFDLLKKEKGKKAQKLSSLLQQKISPPWKELKEEFLTLSKQEKTSAALSFLAALLSLERRDLSMERTSFHIVSLASSSLFLPLHKVRELPFPFLEQLIDALSEASSPFPSGFLEVLSNEKREKWIAELLTCYFQIDNQKVSAEKRRQWVLSRIHTPSFDHWVLTTGKGWKLWIRSLTTLHKTEEILPPEMWSRFLRGILEKNKAWTWRPLASFSGPLSSTWEPCHLKGDQKSSLLQLLFTLHLLAGATLFAPHKERPLSLIERELSQRDPDGTLLSASFRSPAKDSEKEAFLSLLKPWAQASSPFSEKKGPQMFLPAANKWRFPLFSTTYSDEEGVKTLQWLQKQEKEKPALICHMLSRLLNTPTIKKEFISQVGQSSAQKMLLLLAVDNPPAILHIEKRPWTELSARYTIEWIAKNPSSDKSLSLCQLLLHEKAPLSEITFLTHALCLLPYHKGIDLDPIFIALLAEFNNKTANKVINDPKFMQELEAYKKHLAQKAPFSLLKLFSFMSRLCTLFDAELITCALNHRPKNNSGENLTTLINILYGIWNQGWLLLPDQKHLFELWWEVLDNIVLSVHPLHLEQLLNFIQKHGSREPYIKKFFFSHPQWKEIRAKWCYQVGRYVETKKDFDLPILSSPLFVSLPSLPTTPMEAAAWFLQQKTEWKRADQQKQLDKKGASIFLRVKRSISPDQQDARSVAELIHLLAIANGSLRSLQEEKSTNPSLPHLIDAWKELCLSTLSLPPDLIQKKEKMVQELLSCALELLVQSPREDDQFFFQNLLKEPLGFDEKSSLFSFLEANDFITRSSLEPERVFSDFLKKWPKRNAPSHLFCLVPQMIGLHLGQKGRIINDESWKELEKAFCTKAPHVKSHFLVRYLTGLAQYGAFSQIPCLIKKHKEWLRNLPLDRQEVKDGYDSYSFKELFVLLYRNWSVSLLNHLSDTKVSSGQKTAACNQLCSLLSSHLHLHFQSSLHLSFSEKETKRMEDTIYNYLCKAKIIDLQNVEETTAYYLISQLQSCLVKSKDKKSLNIVAPEQQTLWVAALRGLIYHYTEQRWIGIDLLQKLKTTSTFKTPQERNVFANLLFISCLSLQESAYPEKGKNIYQLLIEAPSWMLWEGTPSSIKFTKQVIHFMINNPHGEETSWRDPGLHLLAQLYIRHSHKKTLGTLAHLFPMWLNLMAQSEQLEQILIGDALIQWLKTPANRLSSYFRSYSIYSSSQQKNISYAPEIVEAVARIQKKISDKITKLSALDDQAFTIASNKIKKAYPTVPFFAKDKSKLMEKIVALDPYTLHAT